MEKICTGMTATSLAGHDRGKVYLIIHADAAYVYLADGKCRTLDRISPWIAAVLDQGKTIQNSDIIRAMREYGCQQEV